MSTEDAPKVGVERRQWPFLVRFILWGLGSRRSALACFWLTVVVTGSSAVASFRYPLALVGVAWIVGVIGYGWAIRWVDRHSRWN